MTAVLLPPPVETGPARCVCGHLRSEHDMVPIIDADRPGRLAIIEPCLGKMYRVGPPCDCPDFTPESLDAA